LVMWAVSSGEYVDISFTILDRLLDAGVDINAQDGEGQTALSMAVGEHTTEVLRYLLARGADPNRGNPLLYGLWHPESGADDLETLLAAGADPLAQEFDGKNAVEWAEDGGDEVFIHLLKRAARRGRKRDA